MNDEDGIQLDTYIDRLLAGPEAGPAAVEALPAVDAGMAQTAMRLRAELVRFHPSFRFEERLSRRLQEVADVRWRSVLTSEGRLVAPMAMTTASGVADIGLAGPIDIAGRRAAPDDRHRGLLVGGAIASGVIASGVSLAGAGIVAWRRARALQRLGRLI